MENDTKYECCVCLEEKWTCYTPCKHLICLHCLVKIVNKNCPLCKVDLTLELPVQLSDIIKNTNIDVDKKIDINDTNDFPPLGQ